jgi:anti-sigma factor RsiW
VSHLGDLISDLVDDRLPALDRHRAESHLAGCAECRELVAAEREVKQRLVRLTGQPSVSDLPAGLLQRLSAIPTAPPPPPGPFAVSSERPASSRPAGSRPGGDRPPSAPWSTGPGRAPRGWRRYGRTTAVSLLGAAGALAAAVVAANLWPVTSGPVAPAANLVQQSAPSLHWAGLANPVPWGSLTHHSNHRQP